MIALGSLFLGAAAVNVAAAGVALVAFAWTGSARAFERAYVWIPRCVSAALLCGFIGFVLLFIGGLK